MRNEEERRREKEREGERRREKEREGERRRGGEGGAIRRSVVVRLGAAKTDMTPHR
ncbi:hypothetical protein [Streptomyces sp. TE5632]